MFSNKNKKTKTEEELKKEITDHLENYLEQKYNIDKKYIKDANNFNDLDIDSLDFFEIVMYLEQHYDINLPNKVYNNNNSIQNIVQLIYDRIK